MKWKTTDRFNDHRSSFGKAAVLIVRQYMDAEFDADDDDIRSEFAKQMVPHRSPQPFIYADPEVRLLSQQITKLTSIYRNILVLFKTNLY
jgi:hypothetical protein